MAVIDKKLVKEHFGEDEILVRGHIRKKKNNGINSGGSFLKEIIKYRIFWYSVTNLILWLIIMNFLHFDEENSVVYSFYSQLITLIFAIGIVELWRKFFSRFK